VPPSPHAAFQCSPLRSTPRPFTEVVTRRAFGLLGLRHVLLSRWAPQLSGASGVAVHSIPPYEPQGRCDHFSPIPQCSSRTASPETSRGYCVQSAQHRPRGRFPGRGGGVGGGLNWLSPLRPACARDHGPGPRSPSRLPPAPVSTPRSDRVNRAGGCDDGTPRGTISGGRPFEIYKFAHVCRRRAENRRRLGPARDPVSPAGPVFCRYRIDELPSS